MSFRNEIKIKTNFRMEHRFYKWLSENNGKEIYSKRRITSIYFDNDKFGTYKDSIEGIVPRKKVRLRTYNNFNFEKKFDIFLENKFSSIEGRFKTSKKISNFDELFLKGFNEPAYGIIKPKIKVDYYRKYYLCKNARFTLDKLINYTAINTHKHNNNIIKSNDIIIELKSKKDFDFDKFFNENQFEKIRFSKYCNAVEIVNN